MENLSGMSLDDVKVHRNSDKPAQLQAHAYAQGTDIHLGAGQEKHLPHEAWHVVQQKQGRVKPTMQMKGKVNVNDDAGLEKEADVMGLRSLKSTYQMRSKKKVVQNNDGVVQRLIVKFLTERTDSYVQGMTNSVLREEKNGVDPSNQEKIAVPKNQHKGKTFMEDEITPDNNKVQGSNERLTIIGHGMKAKLGQGGMSPEELVTFIKNRINTDGFPMKDFTGTIDLRGCLTDSKWRLVYGKIPWKHKKSTAQIVSEKLKAAGIQSTVIGYEGLLHNGYPDLERSGDIEIKASAKGLKQFHKLTDIGEKFLKSSGDEKEKLKEQFQEKYDSMRNAGLITNITPITY
jgi:hypothetical protein